MVGLLSTHHARLHTKFRIVSIRYRNQGRRYSSRNLGLLAAVRRSGPASHINCPLRLLLCSAPTSATSEVTRKALHGRLNMPPFLFMTEGRLLPLRLS